MHGWRLGIVVLLTACATMPSLRDHYDHERAEPPLTLLWRYAHRDPGTLVAEGIAKNGLPRKFQFTTVRVTLLGRNGQGEVVSRSLARVPDFVGAETPFAAVLPLTGSEESFELRVEYRAEDIETNGKR